MTRAIEKNAHTWEADQECLQVLAISFTSFGTRNSLFKWIYFFKLTADSYFVFLGTHQWCPVLLDTFWKPSGTVLRDEAYFRRTFFFQNTIQVMQQTLYIYIYIFILYHLNFFFFGQKSCKKQMKILRYNWIYIAIFILVFNSRI